MNLSKTNPASQSESAATTTFAVAKNVINLYSEPDAGTEIVSQAICGARLEAQKQEAGFVYVICEDRYCGWADERHLVVAGDTNNGNYSTISAMLAPVFSEPNEESELLTKLVITTAVAVESKSDPSAEFIGIHLPDSVLAWIRNDCLLEHLPVIAVDTWKTTALAQRETLVNQFGNRVAQIAKQFIGIPYLWGGCTPFGIDCSGLVQLAYKIEGIQLLRDADIQFADKRFTRVEDGLPLSSAILAGGDLLAFGSSTNISHIGIALGEGRFVHASGRQRNFGTYIDYCTNPVWIDLYQGAIRLAATNASLCISEA